MANIDCQAAFNQEMDVLNTISSNLKIIGDKVLENNPADTKAVLSSFKSFMYWYFGQG